MKTTINLTAVEKAENALRSLMISGKIQQGQRLIESRLAEQVGLSRNAIREALNRLKNSGLVNYTPYCGYQVRVFEIRDYIELYELREAIEPIAARDAAELQNLDAIQAIREAHLQGLAATEAFEANPTGDKQCANQADRDFHLAIIQASGNQRFLDIFNNYYCSDLFFMFRRSEEIDHVDADMENAVRRNRQVTNDAHEKILRAIEQSNAETARALMAKHMAGAKDAFLRHRMPVLAKKNASTRAATAVG